MTDFLNEAKQLFPYTQSLRRDFHMHPELGPAKFGRAALWQKNLKRLTSK